MTVSVSLDVTLYYFGIREYNNVTKVKTFWTTLIQSQTLSWCTMYQNQMMPLHERLQDQGTDTSYLPAMKYNAQCHINYSCSTSTHCFMLIYHETWTWSTNADVDNAATLGIINGWLRHVLIISG